MDDHQDWKLIKHEDLLFAQHSKRVKARVLTGLNLGLPNH
jgi:hypothetical protein